MNILSMLNQLLIPIIVTIGVFVIGLYLVSYISRMMRYLKIKESPILGDEGLNIIEIILFYTIFSFLFVIIILSYAFSMNLLAEYTIKIIFPYFNMFFLIMLIFLFSFLFLTINNRTFRYLKGELHIKPRNLWSYKLGTYVELIIKYVIYLMTFFLIIIVFLSGLGILRNTIENLYIFTSRNVDGIITMLIIILAGLLTYLFINAYLKDIKLKSKSNKDKLFIYISGILKHFISTIVIVGLILVFLSMVGFTFADIFVFIIFIIFLIFSFVFIFTPPFTNALCGLSILITEPFMIGDYIKIDEIDVMGEIIDIKLMNTVIRDYSENIVYVPNSRILNLTIQNIGSREKIFPVRAEFTTDDPISKERIEDCIVKNMVSQYIIYDIRPKVHLSKVEGKKKFYEIVVFIDDISKMDEVKTDILEFIYSCMMHQ
ncbi:MAG: mechanosensitive ion channel domain-containing protein [Thermoplasmata archaeon]